jgi:hypothetical protein
VVAVGLTVFLLWVIGNELVVAGIVIGVVLIFFGLAVKYFTPGKWGIGKEWV